MSRLLLVPLTLWVSVSAPDARAECYSDSECGEGRCRSGTCTTACGSRFDSRRLHPEKPSNLKGLLGFSLSSFSSCAPSVPLGRL